MRVSRREFLKGTSVAIVGTGISASQVPVAIADQTPAGTGSATATSKGFGGDVVVSLEADISTGKVTSVAIEGAGETPTRGDRAVQKMADMIIETGGVIVDSVSGATVTSSAILEAACAAYGEAVMGEQLMSQKMKPGTYVGTAQSGYWKTIDLPLSVTVDENDILKIETPEFVLDYCDTEVIFANVIEKFIPRIIENQSLNVDTVAGATVSCAGVRSAVRAALIQAFAANGIDAGAVGKFDQRVNLAVNAADPAIELEADILVCGLGTGGCIATLRACEELQKLNGGKMVSMIAIDRAGKLGGKSNLAHEGFAVNPQVLMDRDNGGNKFIEDTEDLRRKWVEFCTHDGELMARQDCIDLMVDHSGETIDWMVERGWRFGTCAPGVADDISGGIPCHNSVLTHYADPGTVEDRRKYVYRYQKSFVDRAVAQGCELMLETEGYELITEGNTVTGLKARNVVTGQEYVIHAKAIIMNTGGFASNPEMMMTMLSEDKRGIYRAVNCGCDTGLMLQAAMNVGANPFNIEMAPITMMRGCPYWLDRYPINTIEGDVQWRTGRFKVWTLNDAPIGVAFNKCAMLITPQGKRFMSEANTQHFAKDIDVESWPWWAGGPNYYSIVSDEILSVIAAEGFGTSQKDGFLQQGNLPKDTPIPEVYEAMDFAVEDGLAFKADTIEELAQKMGMDVATLVEAVDSYNQMAAEGVDTEFSKEPEFLKPLVTPPFYAIVMNNGCFGTTAGIEVDADMRVMTSDHVTALNGLYCIGNDSLGVLHNPFRHYVGFGGVAQGWLWTGGRVAGEKAAQYVADTYGLTEVQWPLSEYPASY